MSVGLTAEEGELQVEALGEIFGNPSALTALPATPAALAPSRR